MTTDYKSSIFQQQPFHSTPTNTRALLNYNEPGHIIHHLHLMLSPIPAAHTLWNVDPIEIDREMSKQQRTYTHSQNEWTKNASASNLLHSAAKPTIINIYAFFPLFAHVSTPKEGGGVGKSGYCCCISSIKHVAECCFLLLSFRALFEYFMTEWVTPKDFRSFFFCCCLQHFWNLMQNCCVPSLTVCGLHIYDFCIAFAFILWWILSCLQSFEGWIVMNFFANKKSPT